LPSERGTEEIRDALWVAPCPLCNRGPSARRPGARGVAGGAATPPADRLSTARRAQRRRRTGVGMSRKGGPKGSKSPENNRAPSGTSFGAAGRGFEGAEGGVGAGAADVGRAGASLCKNEPNCAIDERRLAAVSATRDPAGSRPSWRNSLRALKKPRSAAASYLRARHASRDG